MAPLMFGAPRRGLTIALAIRLGCLAGASLFYFIGLWLSDPVAAPVLGWLGLADDVAQMARPLDRGGLFWTVFRVSCSPTPMQLATVGIATAQGNFLMFIAAISASRGRRYFGLALLAHVLGDRLIHLHLHKRRLVPALMAALFLVWGIYQLM